MMSGCRIGRAVGTREADMEQRTIGNTDLKTSPIGFGEHDQLR